MNYLLIELNKNHCKDSVAVVVTEEFLKQWIKWNGSAIPGGGVDLGNETRAWEGEEVTMIWTPTDRTIDKPSHKYMVDFVYHMTFDSPRK